MKKIKYSTKYVKELLTVIYSFTEEHKDTIVCNEDDITITFKDYSTSQRMIAAIKSKLNDLTYQTEDNGKITIVYDSRV